MLAFVDFEASSLAKAGHPIEVAWVLEDGAAEAHLIAPAPGWTDWDPRAEAIHHIPRQRLLDEGEPHEAVARRMVEALAGHDPCASAPSWDGKWLSLLLRSAGLPRHVLRLRDTREVRLEAARHMLSGALSGEALEATARAVLAEAAALRAGAPVRHRALDDAEAERQSWLEVRRRAAVRAGDHA